MPSRYLRPGLLLGAALATTSCFPPDDGRDPPLKRIYFPVGLAVSPKLKKLYVANSDFDLQFNAGSLQVYDIDKIRRWLPTYCTQNEDCSSGTCDLGTKDTAATRWCLTNVSKPCARPGGDLGLKDAEERLLSPGRCGDLEPNKVQLTSVGIGAFVTDVIYRTNPKDDGTGRLFMPVRGDATLHWADVAGDSAVDKEIDCGQGSDHICDTNHRRGEDSAEENTRDITLPAEPFAIAADDTGRAIVTTHQINGAVALFTNDWTGANKGPHLAFVLTDLPTGAIGVSYVPPPRLVTVSNERDDLADIPYEPGFLTIFRDSPQVVLLRYFDDAMSDPPRPFLNATSAAPITALAQGYNSRGVAVDPDKRRACEDACPDDATCLASCTDLSGCQANCAADDDACLTKCVKACNCDDAACLTECAGVPLDVYVSNRTPATVLVGETKPDNGPATTTDILNIYEAVPLAFGPSRVVTGDVIDRDGNLAHRVFIVCFDSRMIFIYDPQMRRIEAEIHTGRGPHAFAVATDLETRTVNGVETKGSALGFVGHFTDSYIGVVDLDQRHVANYGEMILTIGEPTPPRASK